MQPWEVGPGNCTFPQVLNTWTIIIFAGGVLALVIMLLCVCVGVSYCCGWKRGWKSKSRDDDDDDNNNNENGY
jgi:membrane glycosyltransferase